MDFLEELVKKGFFQKKELESLREEARRKGLRTEELILQKKLLSEESFYQLKSEYLHIPLREVKPDDIPLDILKLVPEETATFYCFVPLAQENGFLEIGMVYPEDLNAKEALGFLARQEKFQPKVFLISLSNLHNILKRYKTLRQEVSQTVAQLKKEFAKGKVSSSKLVQVRQLAEEPPVTKAVAVILRYALEGKASDIHIEPTQDKLRVRFRMMGDLYTSIVLPKSTHAAIISRVKILSKLKIDEQRVPQDGRFSQIIEGRRIDFRVSTFPTALGEKVAIRVLDPKVGLKRVEDLGLGGKTLKLLKEAIKKPYGMILSTGPTGSGKTTTLYAILQILNQEKTNIITLEDPVEYIISGVNQSQIRPEIGYTFAQGLRHVLRQDPDVIMVGEIRDSETASLATHAALTGHIVLSTLHANNALGVIPRLIDLGVKPFLIPSSLSLAVAQRLVRRLCNKCKRRVKAKGKIRDVILKAIEKMPPSEQEQIKEPLYIWEPKGCKDCNFKGYAGRTAIFEVLKMTPQLEKIILDDPSEEKIAQEAKRQKVLTMFQDGILKVLSGVTTIEEVIRVAGEG